MRDKALKLLGLMRVAGAIEIGADRAAEATAAGKTRLLLLASDAGENVLRKAEHALAGKRAIMLELPFTREELARALGIGDCTMAAVTDMGFAETLLGQLAVLDAEKYAAPAAAIAARHEKMRRRKAEKGHEKTNGKRRTKR